VNPRGLSMSRIWRANCCHWNGVSQYANKSGSEDMLDGFSFEPSLHPASYRADAATASSTASWQCIIFHCCGVACSLMLNFRVFGRTCLFDDIEIGARESGKG